MRLPLALAFAASLVSPALAWIDTGHMVIAEIAQGCLRPEVRRECEELLKVGCDPKTDSFVTCACWADDTKSRETGAWHYINIHFRTDGKGTDNQPERENVVWAISRFSKVLADRSLPKAERADALRFLIHFVGDVHQPMHTVARDTDTFPSGDRGGNDFPVVSPPNLKPEPRNLHFLWDIGGGLFPSVPRPLDRRGRETIESLASQIVGQFPASSLPEVREGDPARWSAEGVALAKTVCYTLPVGSVPSDAYLRTAQRESAKRAALAGYRLAALLDRLLAN